MENLVVEGSKTTPIINFDASSGILSIEGESYPENALEFYKPIFKWIKDFFEEKKENVVFNFKMIYFNTSSSKAILDVLDLLEEEFNKNENIEVNWFYHVDDEDIEESGEEFAEGLNLPYNLISYK